MELYLVLVCQHSLEFLLAMFSQLPAWFRISLSNDFTTVLHGLYMYSNGQVLHLEISVILL